MADKKEPKKEESAPEIKPERAESEQNKTKTTEKKEKTQVKDAKPTKKAEPKEKKQSKNPESREDKKPAAKVPTVTPDSDVKAFNEWSTEGITVHDEGLKAYITLQPRIVPKTGARYVGNRFHKSRIFIVERLINKLMVTGHKSKKHFYSSGHNTGRASKSYDIVKEAFKIIESKTKRNPIEVFVQAVENGAPREEIVHIEYGGARYPKAVECAPQRRIDIVLRMIAQGTYQRSVNKKKSAAEVLANEIMLTAQSNPQSIAIAKKVELERTADASR